MNYELSVILSFSIIIPVIIGCIRLKNIDATYYPLLLLLVLGLVHETISVVLFSYSLPNALVFNIYSLVEALILTLQFYRWSPGRISGYFYLVTAAAFVISWATETLLHSRVSVQFNSYFIIFSSFVIVLMSVTVINRLLVSLQRSLLKNAVFLACIGLVIFHTYSGLVEVFWLYGLDTGGSFSSNMYDILRLINFTVNLLFAFAFLWIPRKQKFILQ